MSSLHARFQEYAHIEVGVGATADLHAEALLTLQREWAEAQTANSQLTFKQWAAGWNGHYCKGPKKRGDGGGVL